MYPGVRAPGGSAAGTPAVAAVVLAAIFGGGHALKGAGDFLQHFQGILAALQFCVSAAIVDAHGNIHIAGAGADGLDLGGAGAAAGAAISLAMISHTLTIPFGLALPRGERSPYCMRHGPSASLVLFDRRQGNMILSLHNAFWQISPGFPGKGDQTT